MTPEEMQLVMMIGGGLFIVLVALAVGYGAGFIDGRVGQKVFSQEEIKQKMRSN